MWRSKFYYCKVVSMSADEYASKELHAWREETAKKDLEVKSILTSFLIFIFLAQTFKL